MVVLIITHDYPLSNWMPRWNMVKYSCMCTAVKRHNHSFEASERMRNKRCTEIRAFRQCEMQLKEKSELALAPLVLLQWTSRNTTRLSKLTNIRVFGQHFCFILKNPEFLIFFQEKGPLFCPWLRFEKQESNWKTDRLCVGKGSKKTDSYLIFASIKADKRKMFDIATVVDVNWYLMRWTI